MKRFLSKNKQMPTLVHRRVAHLLLFLSCLQDEAEETIPLTYMVVDVEQQLSSSPRQDLWDVESRRMFFSSDGQTEKHRGRWQDARMFQILKKNISNFKKLE